MMTKTGQIFSGKKLHTKMEIYSMKCSNMKLIQVKWLMMKNGTCSDQRMMRMSKSKAKKDKQLRSEGAQICPHRRRLISTKPPTCPTEHGAFIAEGAREEETNTS